MCVLSVQCLSKCGFASSKHRKTMPSTWNVGVCHSQEQPRQSHQPASRESSVASEAVLSGGCMSYD